MQRSEIATGDMHVQDSPGGLKGSAEPSSKGLRVCLDSLMLLTVYVVQ